MKLKFLVGILCTIAIATLIGGGYWWWLTTPPAMPETVDEAIDLVQSPRYKRLPETRRAAYMEHATQIFQEADDESKKRIRDQVRDSPELQEAVRDAMVDRLLGMARDYAKADEFNRVTILDRVIAMQELGAQRMAQRQRERQQQGGSSANAGGNAPGSGAGSSSDSSETDEERRARREQRRDEFREFVEDQIETGNPQSQAYVAEFFKNLRERRIQLGLPAHPDFPNRGG